jgi:hypothetical protein
MPEHDNTNNQTQHPLTDREDWELAFGPYEDNPGAALRFGFNIATLRSSLDAQMFKSRPVIEAFDLAMEVLFPFTGFYTASFDLFIQLMDGKLTVEQEQTLQALGVKF